MELEAMLRIRIVAAMLSLIALCCTLTSCAMQKTSSAVEPAESVHADKSIAKELDIKNEVIEKRKLITKLHATGQIQPELGKEVSLTSRVAGKLTEILVVPGQAVKAGQLVAIMNSQEVSQIEAELIEAKAEYQLAIAQEKREKEIFEENYQRPKTLLEAKAHFEEAKVELDLAEKQYKRQEELFHERISAAKEFQAAQGRLASARSTFKQKSADVERETRLFEQKAVMKREYLLAQAEAHKAEKHMNTLKQRLLFLGLTEPSLNEIINTEKISGTMYLHAPINGVVTHRDVDIGETVDRDKQAFTITDLSRVAVIADIPEIDLRNIEVGDKIEVETTSFPDQKFTGTISYISSTVNPQSRTVAIRAVIPNPSLKLKTNMFAEIDLNSEIGPVLACPKAAVQEVDGRKVVYIVADEQYKEQEVKLRSSDEKYFEVESGLNEGDKVVTSGSLLIKTQYANAH